MTRPYDAITFDCYGTLIDWEEGIGRAFVEEAARLGREIDRTAVLLAYHEVEPRLETGPYRPYREVLAGAARAVADRLSLPVPPGRESFLAESLSGWLPFPDTAPSLERLERAGYRLGILSNVDPDLLRATLARLPARFDFLVTAEDVRAYKPARAHFAAARERLGAARWLHAAQSLFHDIEPCRGLGIPAAWINRKGETAPPGLRPDHEVPTLAELADRLCGDTR